MPYFSDSGTRRARMAGGGNMRSGAKKPHDYKKLSESDSKNLSTLIGVATIAFHVIALALIVAIGVISRSANIGFLFAAMMSGCCLAIAGMIMPLAIMINDPERDNAFSRFFSRNYIPALIFDIGSTIVAAIFSFIVFYNASMSLSPTQLFPLNWVLLVTSGSIISAGITVSAATVAGYGIYKFATHLINRDKISKQSQEADALEQGVEMQLITRPSDVPSHTTVNQPVRFTCQAQQLSPAGLEPVPVVQATDDCKSGNSVLAP